MSSSHCPHVMQSVSQFATVLVSPGTLPVSMMNAGLCAV